MNKKYFIFLLPITLIIILTYLCVIEYRSLIKEITTPIPQLKISFYGFDRKVKWQQTYITMYNVGVKSQNDNSPCIGASGHNLCEVIKTKNVCAANFVPLGTIIEIKELGTCIVLDRMNKRFPNRLDWALPANKIQQALNYGIKKINYKIWEKKKENN